MKFSRFSLFEFDYPEKGYTLIYNTLSKSVVTIETDIYNKIINNSISDVNEIYLSKLCEQGILVQDNDNENSKLNMYFSKLKSEYPSYATMVLTSYDCNLKCTYCFENSIKNINQEMTPEVTQQTINWLKKEIDQYSSNFFSIAFSGGEPLLNKKSLVDISRELNNYCNYKGIKYSFGILSNGTIELDDNELNEFYILGLRFIQYTIDGPKEIHDARRILNGGSYNKIIQNIKSIDSRIPVQTIIRINIDKENIETIDELLTEIKSLSIKKLVIDVAPRFASSCDIYNCNSNVINDNFLAEQIILLNKKISSLGLTHSRRFTSSTPCLDISLRQFVIDPLGDLYKCAGFAGMKEFKVGSVFDDKLNKNYIDIVGLDNWHNCKSCEFVPLCGGGCMYINHIEFNDYKKTKCQKQLFSNIVMKTLISSLNKEKIKSQLTSIN